MVESNGVIREAEEKYNSYVMTIKEVEATKVSLTKLVINKYAKFLENISSICIREAEAIKKVADSIHPLESKRTSINKDKEQFIYSLFEPIKFLERDESNAGKQAKQEIDKEKLQSLYNRLLSGEENLSIEEQKKIKDNFKSKMPRELFVTTLSSIIDPIAFKSESDFEFTVKLCVNVLDQDKYNENIVNIVMKAGRCMYLVKGRLKQMCEMFKIGERLKEEYQWRVLINETIDKRLGEVAEWRKKNKKKGSKNSEEEKKKEGIIVFNVLNEYMFYLTFHRHNIKDTITLIQGYAQHYGIEKNKIVEILHELMITQPLPRYTKKKNTFVIIKKAIEYINDMRVLRNILLLNKELNIKLKRKVYRNLLFNVPLTSSTRIKVWGQILNPKGYTDYYKEVVEEYKKGKRVPSELIRLDIKRSFQSFEEFDADSLINVLEYWNTKENGAGYYQGMNFLVGMLLLIVRNEELTFGYLECLMNDYGFKELIGKNKIGLLLRYYQLNRLLFHYYPDLLIWLHSEYVKSNCYAASWFLTIFSNCLHFIKELNPPELLIAIWDAFLVDGWKAIFKTALYLLDKMKEKVIGLKSSDIVVLLPGLEKDLLKNGSVAEFKTKYKKIKVTNEMLKQLQAEYEDTEN